MSSAVASSSRPSGSPISSQITNSSTEFSELWKKAVQRYREDTKAAHEFDIQDSKALQEWIEEREKEFKAFRERGKRVRDCLKPFVALIERFAETAGEGINIVPPRKAIFSGIKALIEVAKKQTGTYDSIEELFQKLTHFLERLNIHLPHMSLTKEVKELSVGILAQVLHILGLVTKLVKQGRVIGYLKILIGKDDKLQEALKRLDQFEQQEGKIVQATTLKEVLNLSQGWEDELQKSADTESKRLDELLEKVDGITLEKKWETLTNWLDVASSNNHNRAQELRHEGTAEWFKEDIVFQSWMERCGSLCWINGGREYLSVFSASRGVNRLVTAGYGKTVLCSNIIEYLRVLPEHFAYFYFDFNNERKYDTYRDLLSSLVLQFAQCNLPTKEPPEPLTSLYGKLKFRSEKPSAPMLKDALWSLIEMLKPVYIVMDALDECPKEKREDVIEMIQNLLSGGDHHVNILITSRPEPGIRAAMQSLPREVLFVIDLQEHCSGLSEDILMYIHHRLKSDSILKKWNTDERDSILNRLTKGDHHMFRWVDLQLKDLKECESVEELDEALRTLPEDLSETYQRILAKITGKRKQRILQVLAWVMFARVTPNLRTLATVYSIDVGSGCLLPREKSCPRDFDSILTLYAGLLIKSQPYQSFVSLSHFSVMDYFKENGCKYSFGAYDLTEQNGLRFIADTCFSLLVPARLDSLKWVGANDTPPPCDEMDVNICDYAAICCIDHDIQCTKYTESLSQDIKNLFDPDLAFFKNWSKHYFRPLSLSRFQKLASNHFHLPSHFRRSDRHNMLWYFHQDAFCSPLHVAVHFGCAKVVKWLLEMQKVNVNTKCRNDFHLDGEEIALYYACRRGDEELARALLGHGANVKYICGGDMMSSRSETLLHASVGRSKSNQVIMKLLLGQGATVNINKKAPDVREMCSRFNRYIHDDTHGGITAFQLACGVGYKELVKIFLEFGVTTTSDPAPESHSDTPFQGANYEECVSHDSLQAGFKSACDNGQKEIIQLLLSHKGTAEVALSKDCFRSAFKAACSYQLKEIAGLLLLHNESAKIILKRSCIHPVFDNACKYGHGEIVQLILSHNGAAKIILTSDNLSPIFERACSNGDEAIVRCLLSFDLAFKAILERDCLRTAFKSAYENGHKEVVQLLLSSDSQQVVLEQECIYTAFMISCRSGYREIAWLLLSHCSIAKTIPEGDCSQKVIDIRSVQVRIGFLAACKRDMYTIVGALLSAGIDANLEEEGGTALQAALVINVRPVDEELVAIKLLLAHGADVMFASANRGDGGALQLACRGGNARVVEMLLENISKDKSFLRWNARAVISVLNEALSETWRGHKNSRPFIYSPPRPNYLKVAEMLLRHGADPSAVDGEFSEYVRGGVWDKDPADWSSDLSEDE